MILALLTYFLFWFGSLALDGGQYAVIAFLITGELYRRELVRVLNHKKQRPWALLEDNNWNVWRWVVGKS